MESFDNRFTSQVDFKYYKYSVTLYVCQLESGCYTDISTVVDVYFVADIKLLNCYWF